MADPADPKNHALRIASPHHTDATVVRPTRILDAQPRPHNNVYIHHDVTLEVWQG